MDIRGWPACTRSPSLKLTDINWPSTRDLIVTVYAVTAPRPLRSVVPPFGLATGAACDGFTCAASIGALTGAGWEAIGRAAAARYASGNANARIAAMLQRVTPCESDFASSTRWTRSIGLP